MRNFIEVTDEFEGNILLNVNCIFRIAPFVDGKISKCKIDLIPSGHNYPFLFLNTKESYEEVKKLIENAV